MDQQPITLDRINIAVKDHFGLVRGALTSPDKKREVARPRQIAMYLAKQLTSRSLPEIGRKLGGRDHTTVMRGIRNIEKLIQTDREVATMVRALTAILKPVPPTDAKETKVIGLTPAAL